MLLTATVAPQSASFCATELPSPRPAPVTRWLGSVRSCGIAIALFVLVLLFLGPAGADDSARGGLGEVAADHQRVLAGEAGDELLARAHALLLVHVEVAGSAGEGELNGVMHHIPGD